MTKEYGLRRIANELHIDYSRLQKRLAPAVETLQISKASTQFVEMTVAPAPRLVAQSECVIELKNIRGAKMRVELNGIGIAAVNEPVVGTAGRVHENTVGPAQRQHRDSCFTARRLPAPAASHREQDRCGH